MLVDSHCHLDFPDFGAELEAVVARAKAAGIGRMVTISTRINQHGDLIEIAERFPDVFCSVGTHPHNAHEELDITVERDRASGPAHPKWWRSARRASTIITIIVPRDAQERGFRNHIAAARETGLPLVIHSRDADADMARDPRGGNGEGGLPGRPALLHRRA